MALTVKDAREIADRFFEAAQDIDKYLDANWNTISRPDYETLSESAKTLLRVSSFMTTVAVDLSIQEMEDDAAELKQVISDAKESLARLQSIGLAIRVAAGLVDLATAIMAKNPKAVFKSSKALIEIVKEA